LKEFGFFKSPVNCNARSICDQSSVDASSSNIIYANGVSGVYWNLLKTKQIKFYKLVQWKQRKTTAGKAKNFLVVISPGDKL
jgi:hypothetical protein